MNVFPGEGHDPLEIRFQVFEVVGSLVGFFIHVQGFVDFDLDGVIAAGWVRLFFDEFDAFEWIVDGDSVAQRFDEVSEGSCECRIAGSSIAVSQNKIGGNGLVSG